MHRRPITTVAAEFCTCSVGLCWWWCAGDWPLKAVTGADPQVESVLAISELSLILFFSSLANGPSFSLVFSFLAYKQLH